MPRKEMVKKLRSFMFQFKRVWHVLRKPTAQEWGLITKVSAIGVLAIGAIGFLIDIAMNFTGLFN